MEEAHKKKMEQMEMTQKYKEKVLAAKNEKQKQKILEEERAFKLEQEKLKKRTRMVRKATEEKKSFDDMDDSVAPRKMSNKTEVDQTEDQSKPYPVQEYEDEIQPKNYPVQQYEPDTEIQPKNYPTQQYEPYTEIQTQHVMQSQTYQSQEYQSQTATVFQNRFVDNPDPETFIFQSARENEMAHTSISKYECLNQTESYMASSNTTMVEQNNEGEMFGETEVIESSQQSTKISKVNQAKVTKEVRIDMDKLFDNILSSALKKVYDKCLKAQSKKILAAVNDASAVYDLSYVPDSEFNALLKNVSDSFKREVSKGGSAKGKNFIN